MDKSFRAVTNAVPTDGVAADRGASDEGGADRISPDAVPAVDWPRLIAEAHLDVDEIAFLVANKVQGIPQREIADRLGWAPAKADRIRKRVDRALGRLKTGGAPVPFPYSSAPEGGSSLRPYYRERMGSGGWIYSLTDSKHVGCPQLPFYRGPILKGKITMTIEQELAGAEKISAEKDQHLRDLHLAGAAINRKIGELFEAKQKLGPADPRFLFDDYANQIVDLQSEHESNSRAYDLAREERRTQAEKVDGLREKLKAQEKSRKLKAVAPQVARFIELQNEKTMLALDIREELRGVNLEWDDLLNLFDTGEHETNRISRYNDLTTGEARLLNELTTFSPKLRSELFRRYPNQVPQTWALDAA